MWKGKLSQLNLWIKATQGKDRTWSLQTNGLYLQGGLYSEVIFNTGLTVYLSENGQTNINIKLSKEGIMLFIIYFNVTA